MKKIILSLAILVSSLALKAQSEQELNFFKEPIIADTFKNESIIIPKVYEEYTYTPAGGPDYKISVVYRSQFKLKDLAALAEFSELSKNRDLKRYVLNQIKPNGTVNLIYEYYDKNYPDDGYEEDDEDEDDNKKEEEIPLENLEIGDIIDYKFEYTYTTKTKPTRKVIMKNGLLDKKPVQVTNYNIYKYLRYQNKFLKGDYPVLSGMIIYNVPKEIKILQKSINTDVKFTSRQDGNKTIYECRRTNIPSYKSEDFSYSYLMNPVIRYMLIQTDPSKEMFYPYQFKSENVSEEDIVAIARKVFMDKNYVPKYLYYLNTEKSSIAYKEVSFDKFMSAFLSTFTNKDKDKLVKLNKFHEYLTNNDELNENQFSDLGYAVLMARFCEKIGLPYKMMACVPKFDGIWDNIIAPYDLTWGLYIPTKNGEDLYIANYEKEGNIYRKTGALSNTEVIIFNPADLTPHTKIKYPVVGYAENGLISKSEIVLSEDKNFEYHFTNTYTISGQQKYIVSDYISRQFNRAELRTPTRFKGMVNYGDIYSFTDFKSQEDLYKEVYRVDSSWRDYLKEYYKGGMLAYLYSEYQFKDIEIDSSRIFKDGDFEDDEKDEFGFKVEFKVKGLLDKTSSDSLMVMNLGRLITEQYNLSNYRINERYNDVYNSNQKTLKWECSIELPKDFRCINLSDFNQVVENEAGIFKSVIVEKGGKLQLEVTKIYKTNYLPKEKWEELVLILQTASSYYNKRLLLVKK